MRFAPWLVALVAVVGGVMIADGKAFATAIIRNTPAGADQKAAVLKVRQAVMLANAAIACAV